VNGHVFSSCFCGGENLGPIFKAPLSPPQNSNINEVIFCFCTERVVANGDVPNLCLSVLARERLESTSLVRTPVTDSALQDFHQHRLNLGSDPFNLKYHLYSIVVSIIHILYLVTLCFIFQLIINVCSAVEVV